MLVLYVLQMIVVLSTGLFFCFFLLFFLFFFFKQKTAYEIRPRDWSSDVCSSDLYLSDQEGAHHWLSVLTDLNNRGLKDILIACVDGLKGFPEAIEDRKSVV